MTSLQKFAHLLLILASSPFLCGLYILSPKRDHKSSKGVIGSALRQLDRPFNRYTILLLTYQPQLIPLLILVLLLCRFIVDTFSYCLFLVFLLHSVVSGMGRTMEIPWSLELVALWALGFKLRDARIIKDIIRGQKVLSPFRFCYDTFVHALIVTAIVFKVNVIASNLHKFGIHFIA